MLRYDELELTESACRHGYEEDDVLDVLHGRPLVLVNRRGRFAGYEILGRNRGGEYLLVVGRVIQSSGIRILRVFHVNRMTDAEHRLYLRKVRP